MALNQKHVFWEAGIIALGIFAIGLFLGFVLENNLSEKTKNLYSEAEITLLDIKAMSEILSYIDINCETAIQQNILFGDKIYQDAKKLAQYEEKSQLTTEIVEQHKKYDLLRTIFWINSMKIQDKCGEKFHTLVYFYDYTTEDIDKKSQQYLFSKFGEELKQEFGSEVLLIPIAKDLEIDSLDLLLKNYKINQTGFFLDERKFYSDIQNLSEIRKILSN